MDSFGELLNVDLPILYPKLPHSAPVRDGEAPVRAKEMGFVKEGSLSGGSIRKDLPIRRNNATLWQFTFNCIPESGQRACSDLAVTAFSHEFQNHRIAYNKWATAWQGKAYGSGKSQANWFPLSVSSFHK